MSEPVRAILGLRRRLRERAAGQVTPAPGGIVLRCPGLPAVPDLNALHLDAPAPPELTAAELVRLADRWLGGLGHRHLVLDDATAGERLGDELEPAGWIRRRIGVMTLPAPEAIPEPAPGLAARALAEAELAALGRAAMAEEAPGGVTEAVLDQLAAGVARLRAAAESAAVFGAPGDGAPVASATLLLGSAPEGPIALIEEVGTLRAHRERGHGRAVVLAAVRAARAAGASTVAVCVDADDWPQLMYAGLGFSPVGRQITLSRAA